MSSATVAAHRKSASLAEIYFDCESYLRHEPDDRVMTPAILSDFDLSLKHRNAPKMSARQIVRLSMLALLVSAAIVALVVSRFSLMSCLQLMTSISAFFILGNPLLPLYVYVRSRQVYHRQDRVVFVGSKF